MSLEDFSNRLMVWTIYIPQGIMAIKYKQHPFETWGRNIVIWLGMLGVTLVGKHPKYGFNAAFNSFMLPKERLKPLPAAVGEKVGYFLKNPKQIWNRFSNQFRPEGNYLEVAKKAGVRLAPIGVKGDLAKAVKDSFWAKLDVNEHNKLVEYMDKLLQKGMKSEAQVVNKIAKTISACKLLSVAASAVLMALFVGVFLQKMVFLFIAPLDKKFVPTTSLKNAPMGNSFSAKGGNSR